MNVSMLLLILVSWSLVSLPASLLIGALVKERDRDLPHRLTRPELSRSGRIVRP